MQLLVSVANLIEACRAVEGGADLVDAKDPSTGALGAVSLETLRRMHAAVAGRRVVSAALGDADDEGTIERAAFDFAAVGVGFVKVGFAGITCPARTEQLLAAAVRGVHAIGDAHCGVVAVAYADTGGSTSIDPATLVDVAAHAGATGVLLDTAVKDGPGLRQLMPEGALRAWVRAGRQQQLTVALAGKLTADDLIFVRDTGADIAGVRGAACESGRSSQVVADKVRALTSRLRDPLVI